MHNLERGLNTFWVLQQKPIQNFLQNKSSNIENFLQHHKEDRGQQNPGFFKFGQLSAKARRPASLTSHLPISRARKRGQDRAKIVIESSLTASQPLCHRVIDQNRDLLYKDLSYSRAAAQSQCDDEQQPLQQLLSLEEDDYQCLNQGISATFDILEDLRDLNLKDDVIETSAKILRNERTSVSLIDLNNQSGKLSHSISSVKFLNGVENFMECERA
ncbi:hypothetical protein GQX74_000709 [Glossina fuscipes]|nr:hypothetical protein GQX74_000709 [Glossina fuscipes]